LFAGLKEEYVRRLAEVGWMAPVSLQPLLGGGNHRLFLCQSGERQAVLKHYFASSRREREVLFCQTLRGRGRLPEVLAQWPDYDLVLFQYLPGEPIEAGQVKQDWVVQAADFVLALNTAPRPDLPPAAEASFSQAQHYALACQRVENLRQALGDLGLLRRLSQRLADVRDSLDLTEVPLPWLERCISPSDFGFHNALVGPGERLSFVDFEFGGSDDPAKLVCDFACQPKVPVTPDQALSFLQRLDSQGQFGRTLHPRCLRLLPLYVVRWCCIMLNALLPWGRERSEFLGRSQADPGDVVGRATDYFEQRQTSWLT
jgi:hypothetical protein